MPEALPDTSDQGAVVGAPAEGELAGRTAATGALRNRHAGQRAASRRGAALAAAQNSSPCTGFQRETAPDEQERSDRKMAATLLWIGAQQTRGGWNTIAKAVGRSESFVRKIGGHEPDESAAYAEETTETNQNLGRIPITWFRRFPRAVQAVFLNAFQADYDGRAPKQEEPESRILNVNERLGELVKDLRSARANDGKIDEAERQRCMGPLTALASEVNQLLREMERPRLHVAGEPGEAA